MSDGVHDKNSEVVRSSIRHVVVAGLLGTTIEWYDFLIYGLAAALVFNKQFFPTHDPFVGTLAAFGAYAVGFLARPLGGAIFGHLGDTLGRKTTLVITMTIMGTSTFLIGLLPTYEKVGLVAPILLISLRLLQGVALGGEWGGAVLMVIENDHSQCRGFVGSLIQMGFPLGLLTGTLAFDAVSSLPELAFSTWGWRLPFLASFILVASGLFVRLKLVETPEFTRLLAGAEVEKAPVLQILRSDWRALLISAGLKTCESAWIYILTVFSVFYTTDYLAIPKRHILDAIFYGALVELFLIPVFGALSDRIGRRPLFAVGAIFSIIFAIVLFDLLQTKNPAIILLALTLGMSLCHGIMFAPEAAFFPEMFKTSVRCSGTSLGFQLAAALSGGLAPMIATSLLAWEHGGTTAISAYLIMLSVVTLSAAMAAPETAFKRS